MKTLFVGLLLVGAAVAQKCEVLDLGRNTSITTTGTVSLRNTRVYTVRFDKSEYQISPQRPWFPRLVVGRSVACRLKKNDIIIEDGYHYLIVSEKPVQ